jgi:hypothetical protein
VVDGGVGFGDNVLARTMRNTPGRTWRQRGKFGSRGAPN